MEQFTLVGDTALHYADSQRGEPCVVLLHGYLESLDVWDDFSLLLRKAGGYRTVSLDLPGHGISEVVGQIHTMDFLALTVKQLLDKLNIEKCVMVGHSMGGYAALAFAEHYPERLRGLALFHSTPNADTPEKAENRRREIEMVKAGRKELLSRVNPEKGFSVENRKRLSDLIESLSLQVMLTEDEGITAVLEGMIARKDQQEMFLKLPVPELFVFGKQDEYIPTEAAEAIAARHPQARLAWLEHSGHMGFEEEPQEACRILTEFIDSLPGVASRAKELPAE
ncbi:MAG: alpha/beta hydrolase [Rikenellaceae bacterium]|jgi:pimeloyl-ACP methyl ester carboxylesterase|nr:alpha/beta hydrolase [Rikenellaceae bacterium]